MISSLANGILFVALVTTSLILVLLYRKLKKVELYHAEYREVFDQTETALKCAQNALANFGSEGKETLIALGTQIDEAKAVIRQLETLKQPVRPVSALTNS